MKFYNPFKPHIVEFANGKFGVREFSHLSFTYYDENRHGYCMPESISRYCQFNSLQSCQDILDKLTLNHTKVARIL